MEVSSGSSSAEYPGGVGTRCCQVVAWVRGQFALRLGQWFRQGGLDCPELDGGQLLRDGQGSMVFL